VTLGAFGGDTVTLDELDRSLPNGFHDAQLFSLELNYTARSAKLHLNLLVGWPEDPELEREAYQEATLTITGLCFCSIGPPQSNYPFLPDGNPIGLSGDPAKPDHLPSLPDLVERFPPGTWCYRFFMDDWNAFIYIAGRDTTFAWIGDKPKHAP
jgi:hypothetical protein